MTDEPDKTKPDEVEKAKKPESRRTGQVIARGKNKWLIRLFLGRIIQVFPVAFIEMAQGER
jgi:hypothetical protein